MKLAIPKKGRLRAPAIELIKKAGYDFDIHDHGLNVLCKNSNLELVFLRTEDIPVLVERGVVDLGITGKDNVLEKKSNLTEILPLEYGECRLCLAGPRNLSYQGITTLEKMAKNKKLRIASSFPTLTKEFFNKNKIKVEVINLSGSIEVMIFLKVADLVVDIVQTGSTLHSNQLKPLETIGSFYSALYSKPSLKKDSQVIQIKKRLEGILIANRYSILEYNIHKQLLKKAEKISHGFEAPTISHLDNPYKVAVKILIEKTKVNQTMEKLEKLGATGIFETLIQNCRP